jgi:hypothetical protein
MPIVRYNDGLDDLATAERIDIGDGSTAATPTPGWSELAGAAFRQDNVIASMLANQTAGINPRAKEEGFNPLDEIRGTSYEARSMEAAGIFNRRYFEAWKAQVDREEEDRRTVEAAGWLGTGASAIAAILDIPTLLPGGALVRGARIGQTALRSGGNVAAAGGIAAATAEAGLQATQQTRTGTESAIAIGSGIVFGGLLGGTVGALMSRAEQKAAIAAVQRTREQARSGTSLTPVADEMEEIARSGVPASVGAAARPVDTLEGLSIAGRAASAYGSAISEFNPIMRSMHSPSRVHREVMTGMMENSTYLKKNLAGQGEAAVETLQKYWDRGAMAMATERYRDVYQSALKAGVKMAPDEFAQAVGRAMRRGDVGENDFVSQAARAWREGVVEPLKKEAIATGQLDEDVVTQTASSYFHRVYRSDKIKAQENDFKGTIRPYLERSVDKGIEVDVRKVDQKAENLRREIEAYEMGLLRRGETMRRREEGGEIDIADGATESDVISMIRQLRSGSRPEEPQRLTSFLRRHGLYDPSGDLAAIGLGPRSAPGFIRSRRARAGEKGGGLGLDDAARLAWDEGFFPGWPERPSIREFLDALDEDFNGIRRVVREDDMEQALALDRLNEVEATLGRMGVDIKSPLFDTSEAMKDFAGKVNKALDDLDRNKLAGLKAKLSQIENEKLRLKEPFLSDEDRQAYVDQILQDIVQKLTGVNTEDIPLGMVSVKQGPLKERTLKVPDEALEPWLEDDVEMVMRRYTRKMSADVEMARKYGRADMKDQIQEVINDYNDMKAGVTDEKTLKTLNDRMKSDIADLEAVRDLLRGNFAPEQNSANYARILRGAMTFNYMRALGGVALASLTETVRPGMVHGFKAYFADGMVPLLRNLKAVKLSAAEAKKAGAITERVLQSRLATLAELTDPYSSNSPFERFLANAANKFSTWTLLNHLTDFQKTMAAVLTQDRILQNAGKGMAALKPRERAYMGYLGLDEDMAARVASEFKAHGETLDGVRVANTERWTDEVARRAYYAAINKDVDSIIVTKGVGDVPLFAQTPIGKAMLQFRTFAIASNQKVLMRGLQEAPSRMLGGVAAMMTVGAMVYWFKQIEAGREVSNNPGTWIAEGLDRSGIFSLGFEINNAAEKAGAPGLYAAAAGAARMANPRFDERQPASRFAVRSLLGAQLGPTFGLGNDVVSVWSLAARNQSDLMGVTEDAGGMTGGDIGTLRRLVPFASLPYWRWFIDGTLVPAAQEAVE